ncbi:solute carrier family 23 protein [Jatrophihabitans sp. DSM 44399]|uniref:Solute carrier family 23 protein n=1 Tax=Jatrophihabitans lederbergiae TaxID=3075547 RepID=A0ABU2J4W4_9ACTN|nr:solute carrier family 23 protein [Jatrophihabitans sp. DSM 44399]MDT0260024.1 solute carrier family 23 protein [Jatrophihabitans sp. DSM 44399]
MATAGWKLVYGGKTPPPGAVVRPQERLSWARMGGLGAQHVVAMFGATFVFPAIMGLNPNLAVLMSGIATIIFLLIVKGKVPSYLGTSAAFVASVAAIRQQGGDSADVTGAILVAGLILVAIGVLVHFGGSHLVRAILPPAVTGAVVMLIGFNLATVATTTYFPAEQWIGLLTTAFVIVTAVLLRGFISRIAIFLALVFGYLISWLADQIRLLHQCTAGKCVDVHRIDWSGVRSAHWIGVPKDIISPTFGPLTGPHLPAFHITFILLVIPSVIALLAENSGHVKAVSEMTGDDLDPYLGRAFIGDGIGTALASFVGGSPTTTYAENIGVMAATRIYSTLAYYIAAVVAILFGFCPKFGAVVAATPGGVLGGITLVLYGMIGLLGAKIWIENRIDFANPINLVPLAAGIIAGIGNLNIKFSDSFSISGIAAGTLIVLIGYHLVHILGPRLGTVPAADTVAEPTRTVQQR